MTKAKIPNVVLTVIIADDQPLVIFGDPPTHRSVRLELTEEQKKALTLDAKHERISHCFLEDVDHD